MSDPVDLRPPRTALVVDDDAGWLDAVKPVLASAGVELIGCTTSSRSTVTLVRKLRPSLLLIGLRTTPGEPDGISLVGPALAVHDTLKVIVASSTPAPADVDAAFAAGACAFVVRSGQPEDLAAAIRVAFSGTVFIGAAGVAGLKQVTGHEPLGRLTSREREILQLVSEGHTNAELAHMLWVTEQTVKFHLSNIYRKLDVSNRTEASRWAQRAGLLAAA
jgi:two-component system, NarL family, response regulator DevR